MSEKKITEQKTREPKIEMKNEVDYEESSEYNPEIGNDVGMVEVQHGSLGAGSTDALFIAERDIVVPGEILAKGMSYLPSSGTYREKENIRATRLGMIKIEGKVLKIIPLSGRYNPKRGDVIVGYVMDVLMSGWKLEINSAYTAVLPLKDASSSYIEKGEDLTKYYALGDYVVMRITNVTSQKLIDVSMKGPGLRKLVGGRVVEVNPYKVPRIIGKQGSMISMIKEATGCRIVVGQNGWVWLDGEPEKENIAVQAIKKIEAEGHMKGMTERTKEFLEKSLNITLDLEKIMAKAKEEMAQERPFERERHFERRGGFGGGGNRFRNGHPPFRRENRENRAGFRRRT